MWRVYQEEKNMQVLQLKENNMANKDKEDKLYKL